MIKMTELLKQYPKVSAKLLNGEDEFTYSVYRWNSRKKAFGLCKYDGDVEVDTRYYVGNNSGGMISKVWFSDTLCIAEDRSIFKKGC